jgi:hypothetical protein
MILFAQSSRYCWGDLGRVHVEGDRNCCRMGANGWDEGNVFVVQENCAVCWFSLSIHVFFCSNQLKWKFDYSLVRIPLESSLFRTIAVA